MNNYFLKDGTREKGPFLMDDLKYQRIRPDTLVKIDNGKWQPISAVRELRFLLEDNDGKNAYSSAKHTHQNPSHQQISPQSAEQQVKRRVMLSIILAVVVAIIGMLASVFFALGDR